jgi:NHLM bacteriocin system ABC transporter peptidase/ATP-binding protein
LAADPTPRRVTTPTVIQMEAVECGAASLAIILGFHGRIVPLEELRQACGVSRDGSKAGNILRAARGFGMTAQGWRMEVEAVRALQGPFIVFWDFNHFLVVEGFSKKGVHLSDPAAGRRMVSHEEFERSFTGVVLELRPTENFQKGGEPRSLRRALIRRLEGSGAGLAYAIILGLILMLTGVASAAFTSLFVDGVLIGGSRTLAGPLVAVMFLTVGITGAATWMQQNALLRLETKLAVTASARFFWHVLRAPMTFFSQRSSGDIGARVETNDKVAAVLSGELATTALSLLTSGVLLVVLLSYDVLLAAITALTAALNIVALRAVSATRTAGNQKLQSDLGNLVGTTMNGLQSIETLKAGGNEADFFTRWAGYQAKVVTGTGELAVPTLLVTSLPPLLTALNTVVILWIGGLRVMDGVLTIGMLMAFQSLAGRFMSPVAQLVGLGATIQTLEADMNRLDDVLRYPVDRALAASGETANGAPGSDPADAAPDEMGTVKLSGHVELRNVTFGYSPLDPPLVTDLSLVIRPGERVALVGGTGSGKSTIARLVTGLQEPWSGEILFDGQPRSAYPRRVLTDSVALVDQEIFLFDGTLRDNLTMWDTTLDDARIVQAAKDASIHDDIAARPGGYEGRVDEGGRNFSGGQRQRLEIARALVGDPSVVVLDEATSALDASTEKRVDDNLRRRGCTCLIVAHRLSTIRDCDEIIVLERGVVVQRGTHEEMKGVEGPYAQLIAST